MFDPSIEYGILGMARSGISAAAKISELGGRAFLSEKQSRESIAEADELSRIYDCEFGGHSDRLLSCPIWIVSPGIPLDVPIIEKGKAHGIKMISEIEFGYQIKAPDSKIIAITGSNGKSTTASLIHHILTNLGQKSILAGNIGDAFCSFPIHKPGIDYVVLEISSFQLDLISDFAPHIAILTNLTPDHLNRYKDFDDYCQSKMKIFSNQNEQDYAVIYKDSREISKRVGAIRSRMLSFSSDNDHADAFRKGKFLHVHDKEISVYDLKLMGMHNQLNVMAAALSVIALGFDASTALHASKSFRSLPHRLEFVGSINGVSFYNDSKATNTDSSKSALEAFERPIRIILGGSDKGEDYGLLTDSLQRHAIKAYIVGESKDKMRQAWLGKLPLAFFDDFEDCVRTALEESTIGDNVVLSPACASFDLFKNFEHRGESFKKIIRDLKREKEQA
jgi:UDP-N-acetylmuramoylalanine--D-glutamate ligase